MKKLKLLLLIVLISIVFIGCQNVDESVVVIYLNSGIDTVEINSEFTDAGVTTTAYGFSIANEIIYNDVDITSLGTYQIVYQVDYKNIIKTMTRVVNVIDETPPSGVLNPGVDTLKIGANWIDASITASDNSGDEVGITVVGNVNTNIEGEYIITYLLEDASGNQSTIVRYVFIYK